MESVIITLKNAAEARRVNVDVIPGAVSTRSLGGKRVQVTTSDIAKTETWLDTPGNVTAYEYM